MLKNFYEAVIFEKQNLQQIDGNSCQTENSMLGGKLKSTRVVKIMIVVAIRGAIALCEPAR